MLSDRHRKPSSATMVTMVSNRGTFCSKSVLLTLQTQLLQSSKIDLLSATFDISHYLCHLGVYGLPFWIVKTVTR